MVVEFLGVVGGGVLGAAVGVDNEREVGTGLAWEVKGWQRSGKLIETVAAELAAGLTPSPAKGPEQVTAGPS